VAKAIRMPLPRWPLNKSGLLHLAGPPSARRPSGAFFRSP